MENTKITKAMMFNAIRTMVEGCEPVDGITDEMVTEFCFNQIEQLANKAEKARANAAKKKAEPDALYEVVASILTEEPQTREEILAQIEGEDISINKVGARLTSLCNAGVAVKEKVRVNKADKMTYRLA